MNINEFTRLMAENGDIYCYQAREWMKLFIDTMAEVLESGERIKIKGLGTFYVKEVKEKNMKCGLTGEMCHVPAYSKVNFNPYKSFKDRIPVLNSDEEQEVEQEECENEDTAY